MLSPSPNISSIVLFDCDYVEKCWKCGKTCFSGIRINLRYKFILTEEKTYVCLCENHALKTLKWNFTDLPLGKVDFLFTQKDEEERANFLAQVRKMGFFTTHSLKNAFDQGQFKYWHESFPIAERRNLRKAQIRKTVEAPNKIQAVVFEDIEKHFYYVRYAYPCYVELGEWEWELESSDKVIASDDFRSTLGIAILELMNRLGESIISL